MSNLLTLFTFQHNLNQSVLLRLAYVSEFNILGFLLSTISYFHLLRGSFSAGDLFNRGEEPNLCCDCVKTIRNWGVEETSCILRVQDWGCQGRYETAMWQEDLFQFAGGEEDLVVVRDEDEHHGISILHHW